MLDPVSKHAAKIATVEGLSKHPRDDSPFFLGYALGTDKDSDELLELTKIVKMKRLTAVIGPSGCGKTRLLLELLTHQVGNYFVGGGADIGSNDVRAVNDALNEQIRNDRTTYGGFDANDAGEFAKNAQARLNLAHKGFQALLVTRKLVYEYYTSKLKPNATPFDWLLVQLFPEEYFGEDIFAELAVALFKFA